MSPERFDELAAAQDHRCPICNEAPSLLRVDHDHATGKVRGLLCDACNKALGFLRDAPELCLRAAEYLWKHQT